ncbi:MAG: discoidin domain-containing protein [Verrucomicrobia bacterium]|nr:discoidin domain-containing protein [Verrucomicrobiota bacterium]
MKKIILASLVTALWTGVATGQILTPVWVQHINGLVNVDPANRLPILKKGGGTQASDGTSTIDCYGRMLRYDATRFLLMVRENGINEGDAGLSQEQKDLAAAYPDRSLIWIEAATGKPMGIAHVIGVHPVTVTGQANQNDFFTEWALDEDDAGKRVLYSTHKNVILRWAPKADGSGWESTPTCAWVEPTPGTSDCDGNALDGSSGGDGSNSWRIRDFRVSGKGTSTIIYAGGGTWRASQHPQKFTTTDGLKFLPLARVNDRDGGLKGAYSLGGLSSHIVKHGLDPARPNLETVYHGHYPGTGWGARPNRYQADPDNPARTEADSYAPGGTVVMFEGDEEEAGNLPKFVWEAAEKDGLPIDHSTDGVTHYDGNWNLTLDADSSLDYIISYAMPSWNNQFGAIKKPGWLGVHTLNGKIASNSGYKLDFRETDEIASGETGTDWGYDGDVTLYPDETAPANLGKAELLWVGSAYGFGVFTVQKVAPAVVSNPSDASGFESQSATLTAVVSGSPNTYQWFKDGVALEAGENFTASVTEGVNKATLTIKKLAAADAGKYRLKATNPLGNVETTEATLTVKAFAEVNHAVAGVAIQSSTAFNGEAQRAVDGNTDGAWGASTTTHSDSPIAEIDPERYWEVDLGGEKDIGRLAIWFRTDCCFEPPNARNDDFTLTVFDATRQVVWKRTYPGRPPKVGSEVKTAYNIFPPVKGQFVRFDPQKYDGFNNSTWTSDGWFSITELMVIGPYEGVSIDVTANPTDQTVGSGTSATFGPVAANPVGVPADRMTFQWQRKGPGDADFADIAGAQGASLTTRLLSPADTGTQYRCKFLLSGVAGFSAAASVTVTPEADAPTLVGVTFAARETLQARVEFSEPMDAASTLAPASYSFTGASAGAAVTGGTLSADGKVATLSVTGLAQNSDYSLTVNGAKDMSGNAVASTTVNGHIDFYEVNVALGGFAYQSSLDFNGASVRTHDGNTDGNWGASTTIHTQAELNPWWELDLQKPQSISRINYWRRTDCCLDQSADVKVSIMDANRNVLWSGQATGTPPLPLIFDLATPVNGQIIRAERLSDVRIVITIAELQAIQAYYPNNISIAVTQDPTDQDVLENRAVTFGPVAGTVTGAPQDRLTVQWQKNGVDIPGATAPSYTLPGTVTLADNNSKYRARLILPGISVNTAEATLRVSADATAPVAQSVSFAGWSTLLATVQFDELMDPATSAVKENYSFGPGITVNSATLNPDGKSVVLSVTGLAQNANYSLTISGVKDLVLNTIAPATLSGTTPFFEINIALLGTATESSSAFSSVPERAIDGNTDGNWGASSTTHTDLETDPYWELDLGGVKTIGRLVFWKRTDCCANEMDNIKFSILDANRNEVWSQQMGPIPLPLTDPLPFNFGPPVMGQYVRLERHETANVYLDVAELQVILPYENVSFNITQGPTDVTQAENLTATFGPVAATVVGAPQDKLSIQWQKNGVDIPGATGTTYTTPTLTLADDNAEISAKFIASGVIAIASARLHVFQDTVAPTVVSAAGVGDTIGICFSELLDAESAGKKENYALTTGGNVTGAALRSDGKSVLLTTSGVVGNDFTVRINDVKDLSKNAIVANTLASGSFDRRFTTADIGGPTVAGTTFSCEPGKVGITAGGSARDNDGDQLHFAYETITGDFDKVVKLTGLTPNGRAGIMARTSGDEVSRVVELAASGDVVELFGRIVLLTEANPAGGPDIPGTTPSDYDRQNGVAGLNTVLPNQWLRLRRTGQSFHAYVRDANHSWAQFASKHSPDMPATMWVGLYAAANTDGQSAEASFEGWQDYVPAGDTTAPTLVSAGTLDKKTVGVKFSEAIKGSSVDKAKFSISQGTVASASTGMQGDSVYLEVTGLTDDNFTVTASGVTDLAGNQMAADSKVNGSYSGWKSVDIGFGPGYVDPNLRPSAGDNPYIIGKSVVLGSGDEVEIDYVGGGYNNFRGDLNHFVYKEIEGDFDVKVENTRYDRSDGTECCANGGLMVRDALFLDPADFTNQDVTRVARLTAATYSMANDTKLLFSYRDDSGPGIGQGNDATQGFGTADPDGFIGKWANYKNILDSSGAQRANTSPQQNLWFRVKREGQTFTVYWSHFGVKWTQFGSRVMANIGPKALVGWAIMTDNRGGEGGQQANSFVTANLRHFGPTTTAPTPTIGNIRVDGTDVVFDFIGVLQAADAVTGEYQDVQGATSPARVPIGAGNKFWRSRSP